MDDNQRSFHIEEYRQIRAEVFENLTKAEALVKYVVLIASATVAWRTTNTLGQLDSGLPCTKLPLQSGGVIVGLAWWIPFLAAVSAGVLGYSRYIRVKEIGGYLLKLENTLGEASLGWEKYLADQKPIISVAYVSTWALLVLGTLVLALSMTLGASGLPPCIPK